MCNQIFLLIPTYNDELPLQTLTRQELFSADAVQYIIRLLSCLVIMVPNKYAFVNLYVKELII